MTFSSSTWLLLSLDGVKPSQKREVGSSSNPRSIRFVTGRSPCRRSRSKNAAGATRTGHAAMRARRCGWPDAGERRCEGAASRESSRRRHERKGERRGAARAAAGLTCLMSCAGRRAPRAYMSSSRGGGGARIGRRAEGSSKANGQQISDLIVIGNRLAQTNQV